jgi:hypothetical protein
MRAGPAVSSAIATVCLCLMGSLPARGDTVILVNGDVLAGEVRLDEATVATAEGPVKIGRSDLAALELGTASGDLASVRSGRTVRGQAEHAAYEIRLRSGQNVVLPRASVAILRFHR